MWLEHKSEGSSACAVFLTLPQAPFKLGQAIFPVRAPVFSIYETNTGSYRAFMTITVRCAHCLETLLQKLPKR